MHGGAKTSVMSGRPSVVCEWQAKPWWGWLRGRSGGAHEKTPDRPGFVDALRAGAGRARIHLGVDPCPVPVGQALAGLLASSAPPACAVRGCFGFFSRCFAFEAEISAQMTAAR